ncbi:Antibiotic biosynthesis monooxygenase [Methylobacterium sp. 4-46]|uniref:putative quinol monooxygenase n=1 Tax=unclassified Methylobacterium TaxID=2615210 RepID=UPI000152D8CD|nr:MULTISPECIES: putative quinol monooxygenase [Methylobacterium]ACA15126.1 Antibiotic biosynthesis monooxygenase [Methylobacterium sp. 4-46]WFT80859.1 putative quinol monooxygenase [Methylobacterium nodulans]
MTESPPRPFVVIAEFKVRPGCLDAFLDLAREDARASVAREPGCRSFDVAVGESDPQTVLFYEVYDDRAAFAAHLETPHLARFRAGFPALVAEERPVRFLALACAGAQVSR